MAKNKASNSGIVYSTDPHFKPMPEEDDSLDTLSPGQQKIKVRLETKHRGGKAVTLVENYIASAEEKIEMGKKLKTFCGTGGSVKDGEILVQGDNRDKVLAWLLKNGFSGSRKI
jgi:translation initiation factor 1